jgi:hypothetical protein
MPLTVSLERSQPILECNAIFLETDSGRFFPPGLVLIARNSFCNVHPITANNPAEGVERNSWDEGRSC